MNKIDFKDYPNLTTPINATNLNRMQTNIEDAINENGMKIGDLNNLNTTEKGNLVSSINEIYEKITWKLVGSTLGNGKITLPENYNELLLVCHDTTHNLNMTIYIPKLFNTTITTEQSFNSGYGQQGAYLGRANTKVYNNQAWLTQMWVNGEEISSSTELYVYYK